jgi:hypothetical protein
MTTQAQVQTAALSLGPLPEEVVARILLSLPLLVRCRCESVCRGWHAFLRSAQHHASLNTRAVTAALRAEGRWLALSRDAEEQGGEEEEQWRPRLTTASALEALAARAGGSLRSLSVAGDGHLRALLPALTRAGGLASLRISDATAPTLSEALGALPHGALPAAFVAQRISLSASSLASTLPAADGGIADGDDSVACGLLRRSGMSLATLSLCLDDAFLAAEEEDDDWADDPRAVRCLRLGRLLALAAWRRVSVSLPPCINEEDGHDSNTLAILFETLLLGLAGGDGVAALPAEAHARAVLDARCGVALSVRDVARVAAAVPPFARLLLDQVSCVAADVAELPRALRAGRVAAAMLCLGMDDGVSLGATATARALAALGVCIDAAAEDAAADAAASATPLHAHARARDDTGGFGLDWYGEADAATWALLCAWLRERPRALRCVGACVHDAAQLAALLAALAGSSVRKLALWGEGLNDASVIACVAPALAAHQLPELVELGLFGSYIPSAAPVHALAGALCARTTRLVLEFHGSSRSLTDALALLQPLVALAHPASGVPLQTASQLAAHVGMYAGMMNDGAEDQRQNADAVVALAAPLFAALAQRCGEDGIDDDDDDGTDDGEDDGREQQPGQLAALMLHADVHGGMRAALRPADRVLLLASRVRRARWPASPTHALHFTPLLHAALLHWARTGRDADATAHVLGQVAAACARARPDSLVHSSRCTEARIATCAALLVCGLAGAAGCTDSDTQLAAAAEELTARAEWIVEMLTTLLDASHSAPPSLPFGVLHGLPARCASAADAALHLSAAAHVPALREAMWALPGFPAFLLRVLTGKRSYDGMAAVAVADDVAAATLYAAVHSLFVAASSAQWHVLLTTWAVDDQAIKLAAAAERARPRLCFSSSSEAPEPEADAVEEPSCLEQATAALALAAQRAPAAAAVASGSGGVLAARNAAAHAAAALAVLQRCSAALPSQHSAQHMAAVASVLRVMRPREGGEAKTCRARLRVAMLHAGALHWARHGRDRDATPALLLDILAACACMLPDATWLLLSQGRHGLCAEQRDAILATLLLCGLLGDDDALRACTPVVNARTWLATHQACVLPLIAATPRAIAAAPAADASAAAVYLAAAGRVAPLRAAFAASAAASFAKVATSLLLTRWCDAGAAAAAACAYGGLARLLDEPCGRAGASTQPVAALLALWRANTDTHAAPAPSLFKSAGLPPQCGQLDGTGASVAVDHLADELTRATAVQRASRDDDECAAAVAAATHLTVLLRMLLEHLPRHPGRGGVIEAAIRKGS